MKEKSPNSVVVTHHEARRDYFIIESLEAGIMLTGCEVKSLREGKASLAGSFARFESGALWLYHFYIAPYAMGNRENPDPMRDRKLLLHHSQIGKLKDQVTLKGVTLVPLKVYFNDHGIAKVELAVAKGKKFWDKREDIKKRDISRDLDRAVKGRNRK